MEFSFLLPTQVIFGEGALQRALPHILSCGRHALFLHGRKKERAQDAIRKLEEAGLVLNSFSLSGEPTLDAVEKLATEAAKCHCDFVVAMGGGSVIDAGKALAAAMTNPRPLPPYLEVVGEGRPLLETPAPFVAIPTTAGTGAEVTRNAVLAVPEARLKVSLRSPLMYPDVAVVDPAHTLDLPPAKTAASGMDALTQLIEAFVSKKASPLTDAICREGLRRAGRSLARVMNDGSDLAARSDMALASLLSGIALANAGLGAAHGLAGPMGGFFDPCVPHGVICARLLPEVMETNLAKSSDPLLMTRYAEIAGYLDANTSPHRHPEAAVHAVRRLLEQTGLPGMATYGFTEKHLPALARAAQQTSSIRGNPVDLGDDDLCSILKASLADPAPDAPIFASEFA